MKILKGNKVGGYTRPPIGMGNAEEEKPPIGGYNLELGIRPGG